MKNKLKIIGNLNINELNEIAIAAIKETAARIKNHFLPETISSLHK